jgi:hypothetical protein
MELEKLNFREFFELPKSADWEVVSLYHQHPELRVKEIAVKTGRSIGEVYRSLARSGGFPNRQILQHQDVKMYADAGLPVPHIAELTGYTTRNIRYILGRP